MIFVFNSSVASAQVGLIEKAGLRVFKRKDKDSFFSDLVFFVSACQIKWDETEAAE